MNEVLVPNSSTPNAPELVSTLVRGLVANRLIIILRASGCAYDLRPEGGCNYCNFRALTTRGIPVPAADLVSQVTTALATYDCDREQIAEIDIYNSGSFLNDAEVPIEAQADCGVVDRTRRRQTFRKTHFKANTRYCRAFAPD